MYKSKKILGIITARGGSKSIPRKNIKNLNGKPLIAYTIEAAEKSRLLTRFVVSTEDAEIVAVSKQLGASVPFIRPMELAQDDSASIDVVIHAINWLKDSLTEKYDYIMILQPTSPLRTAEDIDACIEKIIDTGADSVISMMKLVDFSPLKLKKIEGDTILPLLQDEGKLASRRQEAQDIYKRNAAIFLTKKGLIMKKDLFGKISRPYIMPIERSVDINELVDFELAEFWLKRQKK
ncbi:acylneuraminate cytidylyltransferase family protein [Candidatus Wolfebacteria bacterium]|nr:acylneuraminate cytidylyltransferase family protein [Candidatus Wolfebacteria bacterium]